MKTKKVFMKEHDCWFQKQTVFPPESPCRNAGSNNAISEYRFILKKCWGFDVETVAELSAAEVIAGIIPDLTQVMPGNAILPPALPPAPYRLLITS
jgi:hypothetical protein